MLNLPFYAYIMLAVVAFFAIFMNPKVRKIIKTFTHKDFTKNPKGTNLSKDQQKALSVGLINGEQIMSYTDTLATGLPMDQLHTALADYWGVTDTQSALDTLNHLLQSGHRQAFDVIYPIFSQSKNREECLQEISNQYPQQDRLIEFANNLFECVKDYKDDNNFPYSDANLSQGILAWDMGRAVTVARMACDRKYISENDAWQCINSVYKAVVETYPNWKTFATAYVIGRGMWGGNNMSYGGIVSIAEKSTTAPESPWMMIPLK